MLQRALSSKCKDNPENGRKIFANHIPDKGPATKIQLQQQKDQKKKKKTIKNGKDLNTYFS